MAFGSATLSPSAGTLRSGLRLVKETGVAPISRREFFERTAATATVAGVLASTFGTTLRANPFGWPIGSQTYPHQSYVRDGKFADLCKMMSDIGVTRLELCSPFGFDGFRPLTDAKETNKIMADHGIKSESGHFDLVSEMMKDQQKSIDWAEEIGMTQMVCASLGSNPANGGNYPTLDQVKKAADEYNQIGAVAAKRGVQQTLQNGPFELSIIDGLRTYDRLFDLLDPALVKMQFQASSATVNLGVVGAEYFEKHPGRFISMHVLDVDAAQDIRGGRAGAPGSAAGGRGRGPQRPQVAAGKGSVDWVRTFSAAKRAGVRNYFVDQNWTLTQESVAYLKTLTV
jgi:sugar phosphate isomerase/epimerase